MEAPVQHYLEQVVMSSTYTELRPGSSKVTICVINSSVTPMSILSRAIIGSVSAANIVPPMLLPKIKTNEDNQENGTDTNKVKLSKKIWQ